MLITNTNMAVIEVMVILAGVTIMTQTVTIYPQIKSAPECS